MAGGVIIVWRSGIANIDVFHNCTQQVCMVISKINVPWLLCGIYASTNYRERKSLQNGITTLLGQGIPILVAGDFNGINSSQEKRGARAFVDGVDTMEFRGFIKGIGWWIWDF